MTACEVRINGKTVATCACIADAMVVARGYGVSFHSDDIEKLYRTVPVGYGASAIFRLYDLRLLEIVNVKRRQ